MRGCEGDVGWPIEAEERRDSRSVGLEGLWAGIRVRRR